MLPIDVYNLKFNGFNRFVIFGLKAMRVYDNYMKIMVINIR